MRMILFFINEFLGKNKEYNFFLLILPRILKKLYEVYLSIISILFVRVYSDYE